MTTNPPVAVDLAALDAKLDYLVARHEMLEDLIRELTPVLRDVLRVGAERMAVWDNQGLFELLATLGDRAVPLLRTIETLTAPDVLAIASEASEVVHHASEVRPVGMLAALRSTADRDVQHGLGVALEVLRHLGKARAGSPHTYTTPAAEPQTACEVPGPAPNPTSAERVLWEGATFTGDGFLVDPSAWTEELAGKMATALGLELTDEHWAVLRWVRADWATTGASPNVRRTATGSGVGTKRMYELFPHTPGKTAAMLAGVPKPVGCI